MKKMLISATLLCLSVTSFANEVTTESLLPLQVGEVFSELLPTGTKVGICRIQQSQINGNNNYQIEVKEGLGLIGIYHNVTYKLQTPSTIKYDDYGFSITNSYKFNESGVSGKKVLQMRARKLANGELKVAGIFIETKKLNDRGEYVVDIDTSVHCLNR